MSAGPAAADARVVLHVHAGAGAWAAAAAADIALALAADGARHARPRLLLSGGSTPAPVYAALARLPVAWEHVDVALVDERWLLPDDPDSNAWLVRDALLQQGAAAARFEPMTRPGRSLADVVAAANLQARQPPAVVVLGMGEDGHTASLFPRMRGFDDACASASPYVAVDASGCDGAGRWPRRISLTPAGLAPAAARVLLIRGARKRALLDAVLAGDDAREYPVRLAYATPGAPLQVHWCP